MNKVPPTPFITLRADDACFIGTTAAVGARMGTDDTTIGAAVTYGINARFELTNEGRAALNEPALDMSLRGTRRMLHQLFGDKAVDAVGSGRIHHPRRQ